jgi:hypothetical protein
LVSFKSGTIVIGPETDALSVRWPVGCVVVVETVALLVSVPVAVGATVPVMVISATAPGARLPIVHGSEVPVGAAHVPTVLVAEAPVTDVGSVSATETPAATLGPTFETSTCHVTG